MANGKPAPGTAVVRLGDHEYLVVPQSHAYLANRLGAELVGVLEGVKEDNIGRQLGRQAFELLRKLLPGAEFMDEYEFMGYATREAYEQGEYDPEYDKAPTAPEIFAALKTVARVNLGEGFDALKALSGTVSPAVKSALSNYVVSEMSSRLSPSSPPQSGESLPESSGTTESTAVATAAP